MRRENSAAREKFAADLVGRWKSAEDIGYGTISSRSWNVDSANITEPGQRQYHLGRLGYGNTYPCYGSGQAQ